MQVAAIIVAAGRGRRAGDGLPKQYRPVAGLSVLARTLGGFLSHPRLRFVQVVIGPGDEADYAGAVAELASDPRLLPPTTGGATRQISVRNGLEALAPRAGVDDLVLIHDAARPFFDHALVDRAIAAAQESGAAVPGVAVTDTFCLVQADGTLSAGPRRDSLRAVQTPQAFRFGLALEAHRAACASGLIDFTDDGAVVAWAGSPVRAFEGDPGNVKLTSAADFEAAERRLGLASPLISRTGTGFDVHAFGPGDHVWIGGLRLPADRGVIAHSDGDVVLHALTDALLGAIGDGDIGVHFPPSDERWRGASSDQFLAHAAERVRGRGGLIDHLDVTVLCETPRIGPHREAMRARIAEVAGVETGAVSIKATTTESLGFVGRREGLAAQAAATVRLPAGA